MDQQRIYYLLEQELQDSLSEAEAGELTELKLQEDNEEVVAAITYFIEQHAAQPVFLSPEREEAAFKNILSVDTTGPAAASQAPRIHLWRRWGWAAAAILLLATGTAFLWMHRQQPVKPDSRRPLAITTDIMPGKTGAVLTLSDGRQLVLDTLPEGVVATQNGSRVVLKKGQLVYDMTGQIAAAVAYNTMTTPKGRQFHMLLPDGSGVWLNAASSITYPTVFTGGERQVAITGEAYFEVAKNTTMPFRVKVNKHAEMDVLGTSFNVNAYPEEVSIHTTLLEGAVWVNKNNPAGNGVLLKPGQQARIVPEANGETVMVYDNVDTDKVIAWKNGLFNFEDASLDEVLRQVGRWYDVEIVYEKGIPRIEFGGKLNRNKTLSAVIQALGDAGVHCRLEGRTLIIKM